jgi:hypothetical protein
VISGSIIEIGPRPFVWHAFPGQTQFYSTFAGSNTIDKTIGLDVVSAANIHRISKQLREPSLGLIIGHSFSFAPWSVNMISRSIFKRNFFNGAAALVRAFGQQLIRLASAVPIAVLDFEDYDTIPRSNMFLLDGATTYFKRELPADRWRLFSGSLHRHTRTPRFRMNARHSDRLSKIRPLSLGLPIDFFQHDTTSIKSAHSKTVDVFFAGKVTGSSTVREYGIQELIALKQRGYRIDIPDTPISQSEFRARCARAWITWSPEGFGWQCFRDFEALACGSVPLCNFAGIERYKRLEAGVHALYYDIGSGHLTEAIVAALGDLPRLKAIAARGHDYVLEWHSPSAIARYVVETTLSDYNCRPTRKCTAQIAS